MSNSIDQQFVEFVVKSLVSKPDEVKVERRIDEKGVLLELTVDPEDHKMVTLLAKRGATAQSHYEHYYVLSVLRMMLVTT